MCKGIKRFIQKKFIKTIFIKKKVKKVLQIKKIALTLPMEMREKPQRQQACRF